MRLTRAQREAVAEQLELVDLEGLEVRLRAAPIRAAGSVLLSMKDRHGALHYLISRRGLVTAPDLAEDMR
jgi:hypothetical protein